MPRAAEPEIRLVPLPEVLARLGTSYRTFFRQWREIFTPRTTSGATKGRGSPVAVLSDELDTAIREGREAVTLLRRKKGRLKGRP